MKLFKNKISIMSFAVSATILLSTQLYAKNTVETFHDRKAASQYCQCVGCHGYKAEKSAFNRARPLRELSKEDLLAKLTYYKNRSDFKLTTEQLMNKQIRDISNADLENIVSYIMTLPKTEKRKNNI